MARDYERNTGRVIVELFRNERLSPDEIPAVLVRAHGPFAWGEDARSAVENARALELVARVEILVARRAPRSGHPGAS